MKRNAFKVQTISVYISTTLVLLLLGAMGIMFTGAKHISRNMQQNFVVSAVIKKNSKEADILKLKSELEKDSRILECTYISSEQALAEETEALQANPVDILGYNPYEASLEIKMKHEHSGTEELSALHTALSQRKEIKEVIYQRELVDAINSNINRAGIAMLALLAMLALISWSLIGNLVRLSIYSKRFILHTMKLVGATWGFIRKPFILKNMWIGIFSGLLADAQLALGLYVLAGKEPAILAMLPTEELVLIGVAVIVFGAVICMLCAFFAVNSFLRMRRNDLYFI